MGFLENLARRFGYDPDKDPTLIELRRRQKEELETQITKSITYLYTNNESQLSQSAEYKQQMLRQYPNLDPLQLRRIRFNSGQIHMQAGDEILQAGVEMLLANIDDPNKRRTILMNGLNSAKGFWQMELDKQDLETDQRILGQRRLTQIDTRLEQLAKPQP